MNRIKKALQFLLSLLLLAVDRVYQSRALVVAWMYSFLRVGIYGVILGVTLALGFAVVSRVALLAPLTPIAWRDVAMTWALAVIVTGLFGIGWLLTRSLTTVGLNIAARLGDIASRPVVVSEPRWTSRGGASPAPPGAPAPRPTSPPGGGDFSGYSDEAAYLNQMREDLLQSGVAEENVSELLKQVGRGGDV